MQNKIVKLAAVAVAALLLAFWAGSSREPKNTVTTDQYAVPGLKAAVNEVKTLRLIGAENKVIATLSRGEKGWVVAEKDGYAADVTKVREFLLKLADATLIEPKTKVVESYPKLGVEDIAGKEAKGAVVELEGLKEPVRLIVGNYNGRGGDSTFVRRADEEQSWLAKGNLTVDKTGANWLKRDLVDVSSTRIAEIAITTGGKTLRATKKDPADANYAVADIPKGRELSSEFAANGLGSVLSGLRFDDVLKAGAVQPGDAKVYDVKFIGFDGLIVTAQTWEADGKDYANFGASLDEALANAAVEREQAKARSEYETAKAAAEAKAQAEAAAAPADAAKPDAAAKPAPADAAAAADVPVPPLAVTDAAKDREERLAKLREEAADLQSRFAGWTFVIPAYKYANMNKTLDDLLKPLEAKK